MAIRKSKEKSLQFNGSLEDAKIKCKTALEAGGFKKIETMILLIILMLNSITFLLLAILILVWQIQIMV